MPPCTAPRALAALLAASIWCSLGAAAQTVPGEPLASGDKSLGVVETLAQIIERDRLAPAPTNQGMRQPGETGSWIVPSLNVQSFPHSGKRNLLNKWGDTRMGIGFGRVVDFDGAYFAAQAVGGIHTPAVRVIGYRGGHETERSAWFSIQGNTPAWFAAQLANVDRIEIESAATPAGAGWYSLDDLSYTITDASSLRTIVVDFEDLAPGATLSGKPYAGLTWEFGQGDFDGDESVHGPLGPTPGTGRAGPDVDAPASGSRATAPTLMNSFQSVLRGDAGSNSYPPDTCGAVGPNHFITVVNRNVAIYNRTSGLEISNVLLTSFQPGTNGDPRVCFDQYSGRWIILSTNFSGGAQIFLSVSATSDPTGSWFTANFSVAGGADAGKWPDYPTLGVDQNGIYTAAYMVGSGSSMTIFAIDKAPLISGSPSLGTVTAFRSLPWEGAIQPAFTYGNAGGEYCVSWLDGDSLRVRRVNPPLTGPSLTEVGSVNVPAFSGPPLASAPGSSPGLNTVDERLMMSVYRNGSIWTCHTISSGGRAACRWYQIDTAPLGLTQSGTVADSVRHYFFPSLMVNGVGDVVMGFTGSSATEPASCYYTGRRLADPQGEMAAPVRYKLGVSGYNLIDNVGRNRWGDYSLTTLDPDDSTRFITLQEYAHGSTTWGTYAAELRLAPPDCNNNGVPDNNDIAFGFSQDCNDNGIPDECEVPPIGQGNDCNANGVPDECDLASGASADCNANGLIDECDTQSGFSEDCQPNGVPDECEIGLAPFVLAFNLNTNPGWTTTGQWQFGDPAGLGGTGAGEPDPQNGYTGTNVYGVNLNGDYSTVSGGPYYLRTTALNLTQVRDVQLSFQRWLNSDIAPYVRNKFEISTNGTSWTLLWENTGTSPMISSGWTRQDFDISGIADNQPAVYLRWSYQIAGGAWAYSGWNIDDVELTGEHFGGLGDCNGNAIPDACDIASGAALDCNHNGSPDACDIAGGTSSDANNNGIPDECENPAHPGDLDCNGAVDFFDIDPFVLALQGQAAYNAVYPNCRWLNGDCDNDSDVDFFDIDAFVALLGS